MRSPEGNLPVAVASSSTAASTCVRTASRRRSPRRGSPGSVEFDRMAPGNSLVSNKNVRSFLTVPDEMDGSCVVSGHRGYSSRHAPTPTGSPGEADSARASTRVRRGAQAPSHDGCDGGADRGTGLRGDQDRRHRSPCRGRPQNALRQLRRQGRALPRRLRQRCRRGRAAPVEEACEAAGGRVATRGSKPASRRFLTLSSPSTRPRRACAWSRRCRRRPPPRLATTTRCSGSSSCCASNAAATRACPTTIEETLVGGVAWILHQQIRRGEAEQALDLLPELSEFVLSPYHGVAKSGA